MPDESFEAPKLLTAADAAESIIRHEYRLVN